MNGSYVGVVSVEIDGQRIDPRVVTEVTIDLTTDKTSEGTVRLFDPKFVAVDRMVAGGGVKLAECRIWLGWSQSSLGEPVYTGLLNRLGWEESVAEFRFHDRSQTMKQKTKSRYHQKKSDLDVLKQLATDNGLKFSGPTGAGGEDSEVFEVTSQVAETDWELARSIARKAGWKIYVHDDTLYVRVAGKTGASVTTLKYGTDFQILRGASLSYKLPENKRGRPSRVDVRTRGRSGTQLVGTDSTGDRGKEEQQIHAAIRKHTVTTAQRHAAGVTHRRREYAFENHLQIIPTFEPRLSLNDTITLAGIGQVFSNEYLITRLGYRFKSGALTCELEAGRDAK
jgi:phage protein D